MSIFDLDSDYSNELVSEDTGCGSSPTFSDGDKCLNSPGYFMNDSPLDTEHHSVKMKDNKSLFTNATHITKDFKTKSIATSPIIFDGSDCPRINQTQKNSPQYFITDIPLSSEVVTIKEKIKLLDVGTSPIRDIGKVHTATSPVKFIETNHDKTNKSPESNDILPTNGKKNAKMETNTHKKTTLNTNEILKILENRHTSSNGVSSQCEIEISHKHIQEKKCLERNNSNNSFEEANDDYEVEMILNNMRFNRKLVTPLPKTPSKIQEKPKLDPNVPYHLQIGTVHAVCPDVMKLREENKILHTSIAGLTKEIMNIKCLVQNHILLRDNLDNNSNECINSSNKTSQITDNEHSNLGNISIYDHALNNSNELQTYDFGDEETINTNKDDLNMENNRNVNVLYNEESQPQFSHNQSKRKVKESGVPDIIENGTKLDEHIKYVEDSTKNFKISKPDHHIQDLVEDRKIMRKKKKITKLDKLRNRLLPKYKIAKLTSKKIKMRSKQIPVKVIKNNNKMDTSALINNKSAYEKAVKVMSEIKSQKKDGKKRTFIKRRPLKSNSLQVRDKAKTKENIDVNLATSEEISNKLAADVNPASQQEPSDKFLIEMSPVSPQEPPNQPMIEMNPVSPEEPPNLSIIEMNPVSPQKPPSQARIDMNPESPQEPPNLSIIEMNPVSPQKPPNQSIINMNPESPQKPPNLPIIEMNPVSPQEPPNQSIIDINPESPQKLRNSVAKMKKVSPQKPPSPHHPPNKSVENSADSPCKPIVTKNSLTPRKTPSKINNEEKSYYLRKGYHHSHNNKDHEKDQLVNYRTTRSRTKMSDLFDTDTPITDKHSTLKTPERKNNISPSIETSRKRKRRGSESPEMCSKRILRSSLVKESSEDSEKIQTGNVNSRIEVLIEKSPKISKVNKLEKDKIPIAEENIRNIVTYTEFDESMGNENNTNTQQRLNSYPKESILCKMIQKYGKQSIRFNPKKVSDDITNSISQKLEEDITRLSELTPEKYTFAMNKLVEEIQTWNTKTFMIGFMSYLKNPARKVELYKKFTSPPAPPMTKSEQVLLYVVKQLEATSPNTVNNILKHIEFTLFQLNKSPEFDVVENISRFYALVCRYFGLKNRLRLFVLDAMYCLQFKVITVIKQCLDVWMHVLPLAHMGIAKTPLVTCLVYLLHFYKCEDKFNKVQEIRYTLNKKYCYQITEWNETRLLEMFRNAIKEIRDITIEKKILRVALIILAKRKGAKWCQKNIIKNMFLQMIEQRDVSNTAKQFCIRMLGPLLKPFPADMKVHCEIMVNQLLDMLDQNPPDKMKEAIFTSLIYMNKHNQFRVTQTLLKWEPKSVSSEFEELLCDFVREKPVKAWKALLPKML